MRRIHWYRQGSVLVGAALSAALLPVAFAQTTTNVIADDFTGAAATQNWWTTGAACLTAGSGSGSIPACTSLQDTVGSGALRLTSAATDQRGAIVSNWTFPSNQGIQVTFTTYTYGGNNYGGTGADGIGFYLMDGANSPNIGAYGGSLGYSCSNTNHPKDGMNGAYLGVGLDEYGNFLNQRDNTASGWTNGSQTHNEVGVRGYGTVNWSWLNTNYPNYYPSGLTGVTDPQDSKQTLAQRAVYNTCITGTLWDYSDSTSPKQTSTAVADYPMLYGVTIPTSQALSDEGTSTRSGATPITYKLVITPTGSLSLSYEYGGSATTFTPLLENKSITASNGPLPSSFRFGFGASTGGGTNFHEITCFSVTPSNQTVGAPVLPAQINNGSLIYSLTTGLSPIAGHVSAYPTDASGNPSSTASWDAATLMNATNRATRLWSTNADGTTPQLLSQLDSGAFALSSTNQQCVPDTATIVSYTVNPSYAWSAMPSTCASYLGARQSNWFLGQFSVNDMAALLTPPNDVAKLALPGYVTYASGAAARRAALLFTNNDGFLYSVDASTGALNWGWMPRPMVAQLQNYATVPGAGLFDGAFRTVDAIDANGNWGTYVIGSAEGGALWWDLQLGSTGAPSKVISLPSVGSTAVYPQRQAPVVANLAAGAPICASATQVCQVGAFTAVTGSVSSPVSTLYEFNVATGVANPSAGTAFPTGTGSISKRVTSNLFLDPTADVVYFGDNAGQVWLMPMTGNATHDVAALGFLGTTQDGQPVKYVGVQTINGAPYLWAASNTGITMFGIGPSGWQALWAATAGQGYTVSSTGAFTASASVHTLQAGAVISSPPAVNSGVLIVPVYVAPSNAACNVNGQGYEDLFSMSRGTFPINVPAASGGYLTTDISLGQGLAYSPSIGVGSNGLPTYGASQYQSANQTPVGFTRSTTSNVVQWRVQ